MNNSLGSLLLAWISLSALGMVPREPTPVVYSSWRGRFIVRIEPGEYSPGKPGSRAIARVFEFITHKNTFEPRATFKLENEILPAKVHITDDGSRIVAVDDWTDQDYEKPVVVIHNASGAVIKRFRIDDVLSPEELEELKPKRPGQIHWSAWKIDTNLLLNSNELFVMRDHIAKRVGKEIRQFLH